MVKGADWVQNHLPWKCFTQTLSPFWRTSTTTFVPVWLLAELDAKSRALGNVVQYNIQPETLCSILIGTNVKHVSTGKGSGEDSRTLVVSIANIGDDHIENQCPAVPRWAGWCCCSSKGHLSFSVLKKNPN